MDATTPTPPALPTLAEEAPQEQSRQTPTSADVALALTGKRRPGNPAWRKGVSANPLGRPPGRLDKVGQSARDAAAHIVDDPRYRARLMKRAIQGKLAPAVEVMLWHYAKGLPRTAADDDPKRDIANLTDVQIKAELVQILMKLETTPQKS